MSHNKLILKTFAIRRKNIFDVTFSHSRTVCRTISELINVQSYTEHPWVPFVRNHITGLIIDSIESPSGMRTVMWYFNSNLCIVAQFLSLFAAVSFVRICLPTKCDNQSSRKVVINISGSSLWNALWRKNEKKIWIAFSVTKLTRF